MEIKSVEKKRIYELLTEHTGKASFAQATQDLFVEEMLQGKKEGVYLEIGGGHPSDSNNTLLLEQKHNWSGFSIELDRRLIKIYNSVRKNKAIEADATCFNYLELFSEKRLDTQIDYLSIDIDPPEYTYSALLKIPHHKYRFSVITFEHDRYSSGDKIMHLSRDFLSKLGYQLVVSNLKTFGNDYEDWWVDPNAVSATIWGRFHCNNIEFADLWMEKS
jgi:hypothetical protein